MRSFAQKQKPAQKAKSESSVRPKRAFTRQSREVSSVLHLQRTIGNHAVQRFLQNRTDKTDNLQEGSFTGASSRFAHDFSRIPVHHRSPANVQAKLTVSSSGDIYEQEADRVAEQVMRVPEPQPQRTCACGGGCPKCQQDQSDQAQLRTKRVGSSGSPQTAVPYTVQDILRSNGQPLDPMTRSYMEPRFGYDFTNVRVHSDSKAATLATALKARAFAVGNHIIFNRGMPSPYTSTGRHMLAHELTHVVQQSSTKPVIARLSASDCASDCAKEDGKNAATGKFSITVYADKEGPFLLIPKTQKVGHSWLQLEDDQGRYWTYGFWPQEGYDASNMQADVEGCVHHPDTSHKPTASQRFELTAAQFTTAFNVALKSCLDKPKYNLFGLQCTDFVKQVLAAAGQGSFGGFGLIWESPNALDTWIRTHSLLLGTSITAGTSAQGGAGAGSFGADLTYRYQFYSLLGEKLRLYGLGRAEVSAPVKSLTAGAGLELNPQKVWLPTPFVEGGGILGDLSPVQGQSPLGAGVTGAVGLRFNIDEIGVVGIEYNVVKDIVNKEPVLHRLMLTAGIRIF